MHITFIWGFVYYCHIILYILLLYYLFGGSHIIVLIYYTFYSSLFEGFIFYWIFISHTLLLNYLFGGLHLLLHNYIPFYSDSIYLGVTCCYTIYCFSVHIVDKIGILYIVHICIYTYILFTYCCVYILFLYHLFGGFNLGEVGWQPEWDNNLPGGATPSQNGSEERDSGRHAPPGRGRCGPDRPRGRWGTEGR